MRHKTTGHVRTCPKPSVFSATRRTLLAEGEDLLVRDQQGLRTCPDLSGAVEGAVKHVIGERCDQGGMRWIRECAEVVVQLRCIELNGDWDAFVASSTTTSIRRSSTRSRRYEYSAKIPRRYLTCWSAWMTDGSVRWTEICDSYDCP